MTCVSLPAYENIAAFEILLRRLLRWHLMSQYGRGWLVKIGAEYYELIELRIQQEKRTGQYSKSSSELSFLTLGELISIIFERLWHSSFKVLFKSDLGLREALRRSILPLRNKVAHFRTVDQFDLNLGIRYALELKEYLYEYYGSPERIPLYVTSDLDATDDLIDKDIIRQIRAELSALGIDYFWDEFGKLESVRFNSVGCGFGIFDDNIFIELDLSLQNIHLDFTEWFELHKYCISSIVFDDPKFRIFMPSKSDKDSVKRAMNSLNKRISHNVRFAENDHFVESEYLINRTREKPVGLAF